MLKGFEQRVEIRSLQVFMADRKMKALPADEQMRLTNQHIAMKNYATILGDRIQNFAAPLPE